MEGHEGRFSRDFLPVFSAVGPCEQFWHEQGCPLFDVIHPAFLLPTTPSPTFQGAPKDGFGEAVVACDMPEPCDFPDHSPPLFLCLCLSVSLPLSLNTPSFSHVPYLIPPNGPWFYSKTPSYFKTCKTEVSNLNRTIPCQLAPPPSLSRSLLRSLARSRSVI